MNASGDNLSIAAFQRTYPSAPIGMLLLTPERQILSVDDVVLDRTGAQREAVLETDLLEGFSLSTSKVRLEALFRLTREGRAGDVSNVDYPDCDTMVWWHCWMWPVRDDDDRVIGIMQGCQMHYAPVSGAADLRLIERP